MASSPKASEPAPPKESGGVEPTPDVPRDSRVRRFFRRVLRRRVLVPAAVVAAVALDVLMVAAISGWESEAAELRSDAASLGERLGTAEAALEGAQTELALVEDLGESAETWAVGLSAEADVALAQADAFRQVTLDLKACADTRQQVTALLWARGSGAAADVSAQATQTCASAQAQLDTLLAAEG